MQDKFLFFILSNYPSDPAGFLGLSPKPVAEIIVVIVLAVVFILSKAFTY